MSEFTSPIAQENEIVKAEDFNYGYNSGIENVVSGLKGILTDSSENFVIGGKVKPYSLSEEGGLNVSVESAFIYCGSNDTCAVCSDITEPISFEVSGSVDRIDIVEACAQETEYDQQSRMFNDPSSGSKITEKIKTKKMIELKIKTKKGTQGSDEAPSTDEGWVKLAEVRIESGMANITEDKIFNVTARKAGEKNTSWTNEADKTYNPSYLGELFGRFLVEHNEDGSHREEVIKSDNIQLGTGSDALTLAKISLGDTVFVKKHDSITPAYSGVASLSKLATCITELYLYVDSVIKRFTLDTNTINAISTENVDLSTGGTVKIDGVTVNTGGIVLLKDQKNATENGLYKVESESLTRVSEYSSSTSLSEKLFYSREGSENQGKMFFVKDSESIVGSDDIEFLEATFSPFALAGTFVMRDENGRFKASYPSEEEDVAIKKNVTELENTITDLKSDINTTNETLKSGIENLKDELLSEDSKLQSEIDTIENETIPTTKTTLENEITSLETEINKTIENEIETAINNLSKDVSTNASNIESILSRLSDLETKISTVESDYKAADKTLQTNIDNVGNDIHIKISTSKPSSVSSGDIWLE